jgi:dienelactone hydrolase
LEVSRFGVLVAALVLGAPAPASAQDHEREARWAKETLASLNFGEAVYLKQASGHRFLALWLPTARPVALRQDARPREPRREAHPVELSQEAQGLGAVIVAHGRGWAPDVDLYGDLRVRLADAGWSTLSIQLPVLAGNVGKLGDYMNTYPDAIERFAQAAEWLRAKGYRHIAIVSHSLGATMANQYLIRTDDGKVGAWVFLGILNGLEDMFRLKIPVLDVYAEHDWGVIVVGADERRKQIERVPGSRQVMIRGAQHFYEQHRDEVVSEIVRFLAQAFGAR